MTHPQDTSKGPNPSGICQCGCGKHAPIAKYNLAGSGWVKGLPKRFIQGHHTTLPVSRGYHANTETGCWDWIGPLDRYGYGRKGNDKAHRYVYELLRGPIPAGMVLHHRCENRRCVNPAHLEPLTNTENIRRSRLTTITPEIAAAIRALAPVCRYQEIAAQFGVSEETVSKIHRRRRWAP